MDFPKGAQNLVSPMALHRPIMFSLAAKSIYKEKAVAHPVARASPQMSPWVSLRQLRFRRWEEEVSKSLIHKTESVLWIDSLLLDSLSRGNSQNQSLLLWNSPCVKRSQSKKCSMCPTTMSISKTKWTNWYSSKYRLTTQAIRKLEKYSCKISTMRKCLSYLKVGALTPPKPKNCFNKKESKRKSMSATSYPRENR